MTTSTPQTPLAAGVAELVRAELGRQNATTAQIMEWTGLKAQTARSRRAGNSDWTLAELWALSQGLNILFNVGVTIDPTKPFDPTKPRA